MGRQLLAAMSLLVASNSYAYTVECNLEGSTVSTHAVQSTADNQDCVYGICKPGGQLVWYRTKVTPKTFNSPYVYVSEGGLDQLTSKEYVIVNIQGSNALHEMPNDVFNEEAEKIYAQKINATVEQYRAGISKSVIVPIIYQDKSVGHERAVLDCNIHD